MAGMPIRTLALHDAEHMSSFPHFLPHFAPHSFRIHLTAVRAQFLANLARRLRALFIMRSMIIAGAMIGSVAWAQGDPETEKARKGIAILPSVTDPAISTFNTPHMVFVDRDIVIAHKPGLPADRHELLLWIPGTKPSNKPGGEQQVRSASLRFCQMAATLGYHVIDLQYPNDISAAVCHQDPEPPAFEDFRLALIAGGASKHITVSRTDSIENRLIKLLQRLQQIRPKEEWGQFLNADGSIKWEAIAVAGQSQGGGHAALLGILHHVSRVICFGAPKDYSLALHAPAAWYEKPSATPKKLFFAFNHEQDFQGCSPKALQENLRALKLDEFGPPVNVDTAAPPYAHSHNLMTNYPGTKVDSKTAHTTMISGANEQLFGKVWRYMLTD